MRYLASFVLEYGIWVWLAIGGVWLIVRAPDAAPTASARRCGPARNAFLVVGLLVAHWALLHVRDRRRSLRVPGLQPPDSAALDRRHLDAHAHQQRRVAWSMAALGVFLLASLPIPWMHWAETRELVDRGTTLPAGDADQPAASRLRRPGRRRLGWLAALADRSQRLHAPPGAQGLRSCVGCRCFPTREDGARISWDSRAVIAEGSVGVLGWVLPNVAIIDIVGLNDHVVARLPPPPHAGRGPADGARSRSARAYVATASYPT